MAVKLIACPTCKQIPDRVGELEHVLRGLIDASLFVGAPYWEATEERRKAIQNDIDVWVRRASEVLGEEFL